MIIKFGDWTPDLAPLNSGAGNVLNAIPERDGYRSMPAPVPVGPSELTAVPLLMVVGESSEGIQTPIVFGDTAVFRAQRTQWQNLTEGTPFEVGTWSAITWGDAMYAVSDMMPILKINLGGGTGTSFLTLPNNLSARYMAIVADFVVLGRTSQNQRSAEFPFRVHWSGLGRPEDFVPNPATQSDLQDVSDIGDIRGIIGGEYGLILGSDGLSRMDYMGPPEIFKFSTLETGVGCLYPKTAVKVTDRALWYSRLGWRMSNGGPSVPIGEGKVDQWFSRRVRSDLAHMISAVVLRRYNVVMWSYPSVDSVTEGPDEVLAFNWITGRWSRGKMDVQLFGLTNPGSTSTDDDAVNIGGDLVNTEAFTDSYDFMTDSGFEQSELFEAAIVDNTLARLSENTATAVVETAEVSLTPGKLTTVRRFRPLVHHAGNVTAEVTVRNRLDKTDFHTAYDLVMENSGAFSRRISGRYHIFKLNVVAPFDRLIGIEIVEAGAAGSK